MSKIFIFHLYLQDNDIILDYGTSLRIRIYYLSLPLFSTIQIGATTELTMMSV